MDRGRDREANINAGGMKGRGMDGRVDREDMRGAGGDRDGRDRDDGRGAGAGIEGAGGRRGSMSGGGAKDAGGGAKSQRRASLSGGGAKDGAHHGGHAHGGDAQMARRDMDGGHSDGLVLRAGANVDDPDVFLDRGTIKRAGRALIARHQGGRESRHHGGGRESRAHHRASASASVQHTRSHRQA